MGFLELIGAVAGKGGKGGLTESVGDLLKDGGPIGGLGGLLSKLESSGLGEQGASWVSKGKNLPVSAAQIEAVLGNEHVRAVAGKLGITPEKAASQLARYLPQIVDRVTPDGKLPDAASLEKAIGGLLGR